MERDVEGAMEEVPAVTMGPRRLVSKWFRKTGPVALPKFAGKDLDSFGISVSISPYQSVEVVLIYCEFALDFPICNRLGYALNALKLYIHLLKGRLQQIGHTSFDYLYPHNANIKL